ncbi:MAG: ABC transporter substrate-binding protein, partial [Candidatus Limnocylindrales bacterium]
LLARTLCTPLLGTDPSTGELVPGIASSWLIADGGGTVSLRLRDDVVFSDGTPLSAADVAFSLSRVASADYASTSAELLSPIAGYPEIHGDVSTDKDNERRRLLGVEVRDDENVLITMREPLSDFLRVLTSPVTSPVSQAAAERDPDGFARNPVCVGPYVLEKPYAPGDTTVRLVRSTAYTPVDSSRTRGGASYADAVELLVLPSADAAAEAVLAGKADVAAARPTDDAQSGPGVTLEYLGLPTAVAGFEDPAVRRALALAIDREELVRRVFPGTRVPATGFLPRGQGCTGLASGGDVDAARELLRSVGADLSGVRVPLHFNDELRNRALVAEVARQLREAVGLIAVPTPLSYDEFLGRGTGTRGFEGMFRFSWSVPHSSVDGYLHPLFSSDRIGRDNLSRFSDPDVDRVLDRVAREAEDDEDRALGYARVTELLCEKMPMVPLTTSLSRWVLSNRVASATGSVVDASTGELMVRELYLR